MTLTSIPTAVAAKSRLAADEPALRPAAVMAADLTRRYGDGESAVQALRGVSLEIPNGQFAAVMGPSGSGKSTLMHMLAGLDAPTSGTVEIGGRDIGALPDREMTRLRRSEIGFIFQSFNLLPTLTAEENILLPLAIARRPVDSGWISDVLTMVGLADRRGHRPAQLSGGQQQRVAIGRALVTEPTVLFADEPTGNLDSETGNEILRLLREASGAHGQTTLMVTHDPRAAAVADRVLYLADGVLVADLDGPTEAEIHDLMKEATR